MGDINRHNEEIMRNLKFWQEKPVLKSIYRHFHEIIAQMLPDIPNGHVVEIGSGVADITIAIPGCLRTDIFPNPWILAIIRLDFEPLLR